MEGENNQELPKPCKSGCGFFGHHNFGGRCSKCFKNLEKESANHCFNTEPKKIPIDSESKLASLMDSKLIIKEAVCESSSSVSPDLSASSSTTTATAAACVQETESVVVDKKQNRCFKCHKRVNLMGFGCRCGHVFCTAHRYSEAHNCQYDYREEAQEEIRKANPVVVAKKVEKI